MFSRVIEFMGLDSFNKIKNSTVLIVGVGGVGGYAMESLVRSGIGHLILIDFDKIEESNLNRQIISNNSNIEAYKVDEAKKRILEINPDCLVDTLNIFLDKDTIKMLDNYKFDYIIDACDSVLAKKLLIDYAIDNDIKIISSMGTAKKMDPTKLEILDIRKTSYDPLAKIIRKYVLDKKTNKKIMVVSSTEAPIKSEILASLVFVPATAGMLCGKYVIDDIIKDGK